MSRTSLIFQGFTARTHEEAVNQLFRLRGITRVVISVAFANEGGVRLIEKELARCASRATVFIGIRNDVTSVQGARRLFNLGVSLYAVDTGCRARIFHPKIYLTRNPRKARLLIGSANLTLGGLHNNIEAGVVIAADLADTAERTIVEELENELKLVVSSYPEHVFKIKREAQLGELLASGRLVDEHVSFPSKFVGVVAAKAQDKLAQIGLKVPLKRGVVPGAKKEGRRIRSPQTSALGGRAVRAIGRAGSSFPGNAFKLVWESKPLTRRDLDVPTGTTTHRTGSINLDKGQLANNVDHRSYFRKRVFPALSWARSSKRTVDEAHGKFTLVVKGVNYGEFDLRLGHSTSTKSKSYLQKNAMTRLSWGPMRRHVARQDLIGRTLSLYRDLADPTRFLLKID